MRMTISELRSLVKQVLFEEAEKGKKVKKNNDYKVYHNTYSSAIDAALDYAKSKGYESDSDDV